eukprot:6212422-Pleurochrysis_carterae.AAC.6
MLDIDYLGEVYNPDGLPGLYALVPCTRQPPGGERGRELRDTAVSSQFTTLLLLKRLASPEVSSDSQNSTEQPLKDRVRSESAAKTDSLEPRTPELACSPSDSLNGDLYQSYHPGWQADDKTYELHSVGG